ncbi:hypothetical protein D3C75_1141610 [compost metagenome]
MAETTDTDDADFLAGPRLPVAKWRPGCDACAKKRRYLRQFRFRVRNLQHEVFVNGDAIGVTAVSIFATAVEPAVVCLLPTMGTFAILFQTVVARLAMAAAAHHASDAHDVSHLVVRD